ncbi:MAG: class A beta-lactamase-related serine hydrolase, partial [Defluviitaleaceae bacterium]|nr:class A beta-lactamase-related serine hydrolase [Defluviitaleaceae bacterium]
MRFGNIAYTAIVLIMCVVIVASSTITFRNVFIPQAGVAVAADVVPAADFELAANIPEAEEQDAPEQRHIPWLFTAHEEPDFSATIVASFNPQPVTIVIESDDGWALIETSYGEVWVYLRENLRYIHRVMGLFEEKPDDDSDEEAYPIDVINPQLVRVLDQDGYWLQVETWLGPKWINLRFMPPRSGLDEFMARFGGSISIYYENLETGFIYTYNADRVFFGASMIKAPYALWVYLLAEAGYADLSAVHTYTSADHWGGSGSIQRMPFGSTFTEAELLRLALYVSDNIAFRMLVRRLYGVNGFREWVEEIGGNPNLVHTVTYSHMTANETGRFAR